MPSLLLGLTFCFFLCLKIKKKDKYGKNTTALKGFREAISANEKIAKGAKVSEKQALEFLKKQAIWQIYLPAPKKIIRPRFYVSAKDEVHKYVLKRVTF